jgi:drug/metabolite transporter (DMT)-like permease
MKEFSRRTYGIALVTAASVFWSTAGLFVRALDLDVWTMTAWRSVFAALSLLLVVVLQRGRRFPDAFKGLGRPGVVAIPLSAVSMFCYVAALKLTTVANVQVVYATVPFVAAAVAFVAIGERMSRRAMWASALALMGVILMAGAATRPDDLAGNALALLMTVTFAIVLVTARRHPTIEMAPVNALAAALCAAACWPLTAGGLPSASQLVILALFGFTTTALSYLLFLTGGRHIPSGEAGLIALLDVVLAPIWVWLVFSENPGQAAIIGGAVVLAAVVWYLAGNLGERKA